MKIQYDLTSLPAGWVHTPPGTPVSRDKINWSGAGIPPAIGTRVYINMNGLGFGSVESYFVEGDWLGVCVRLEKQPEWHRQQNAGRRYPHSALVFGFELL